MFAFLLLSFALGSSASAQAEPSTLQKERAEKVLKIEEDRQKAGFCTNSTNNAALNGCLSSELVKTDADYKTFARAVGALMRLDPGAGPPAATPGPIPFDTAEASWLAYRNQTCDVVYKRYQGGTMSGPIQAQCVLALTVDHMRELRLVYTDLFD